MSKNLNFKSDILPFWPIKIAVSQDSNEYIIFYLISKSIQEF